MRFAVDLKRAPAQCSAQQCEPPLWKLGDDHQERAGRLCQEQRAADACMWWTNRELDGSGFGT